MRQSTLLLLLLLWQVGIALSYAVWAVSHNFTVFFIARVIGGVSKGNISLSFAVISDITAPSKRAKGMVIDTVTLSNFLHIHLFMNFGDDLQINRKSFF